jgi:hypothetical protein
VVLTDDLLQVSMSMPTNVNAQAPGGALGPVDVATEFLACVNASALSRNHVASLIEKASEKAKRALVIAGLPPGTLPYNAFAPTLSALKPMVCSVSCNLDLCLEYAITILIFSCHSLLLSLVCPAADSHDQHSDERRSDERS